MELFFSETVYMLIFNSLQFAGILKEMSRFRQGNIIMRLTFVNDLQLHFTYNPQIFKLKNK